MLYYSNEASLIIDDFITISLEYTKRQIHKDVKVVEDFLLIYHV